MPVKPLAEHLAHNKHAVMLVITVVIKIAI